MKLFLIFSLTLFRSNLAEDSVTLDEINVRRGEARTKMDDLVNEAAEIQGKERDPNDMASYTGADWIAYGQKWAELGQQWSDIGVMFSKLYGNETSLVSDA